MKCVEWHPTKGLLVSGSKDNQIKFWDPRTGTALSTLYAMHLLIPNSTNFASRHQHKNTIQALSWSPNGNLVASASRDQTVRVFDIRAMKEFRILKGHKKEVCCMINHSLHSLHILLIPPSPFPFYSCCLASRTPSSRFRRFRRSDTSLGLINSG